MRRVVPHSTGFTHPAMVIACVGFRLALLFTCTCAAVAVPQLRLDGATCASAFHVTPAPSVPVFPLPELSAVVVPVPSLNAQFADGEATPAARVAAPAVAPV